VEKLIGSEAGQQQFSGNVYETFKSLVTWEEEGIENYYRNAVLPFCRALMSDVNFPLSRPICTVWTMRYGHSQYAHSLRMHKLKR
jgi:hypothetical protein